MKIRPLIATLALSLLGSVMTAVPANAAVCPGSMVGAGTSVSPCQIATPAQLQAIASDLTLGYKLMNDLDMSNFSWTSIGGPDYSNPFSGEFDGNSFTIANLSRTETDRAYAGLLFNYVDSSGSINNLKMTNLSYVIVANNSGYLGGVVGILDGAIVNSSIEGQISFSPSGNVDRANYIGAVAGRGTGSITAVQSDVDFVGGGIGGYLSGFIGIYETNATIMASIYTGNISNSRVSGIDNGFTNSSNCTFISFSFYDNQRFGSSDSSTCVEKGQSTAALKSPTAATGIYQNWTSYWNQGSDTEYPALTSFLSNPGTPTSVGGVAGDGSAAVSWTAPANTGGRSISTYTATSTPGGFTCSSSTTSCTVNGLTNGTAYSFAVTAATSFGMSSTSSSSSSLTPTATTQTNTTPSGSTSTANVSESVATVKSANVKKNKKYSAKSVAKMLSISVPKKATVKVTVASSSRAAKVCTKSGTRVSTKKKLGTCSVTVTVQPARVKGKKQPAQVTSGNLVIQ